MTLQYGKKCKKHAFEQRLVSLEIGTVFITDRLIFNLLEFHTIEEKMTISLASSHFYVGKKHIDKR